MARKTVDEENDKKNPSSLRGKTGMVSMARKKV